MLKEGKINIKEMNRKAEADIVKSTPLRLEANKKMLNSQANHGIVVKLGKFIRSMSDNIKK